MTRISALAGIALLCIGAATAGAVTLQSMYDQAVPGEGYDKLVILQRGQVYTGGLTVAGGTCCIRGNDAVCMAGGFDIAVSAGATLDLFDTVITGHRGVWYHEGSQGIVRGNTIYDGFFGIRAFSAEVTIENNVVAYHDGVGIAADTTVMEPYIRYNDVWNNQKGNYMSYCSG
jgi:hypothetical protein